MTAVSHKRPPVRQFACEICGCKISRIEFRMRHTCENWKCRQEYKSRLRERVLESEERYEQRRSEFRSKLNDYRDCHAPDSDVDDPESFHPVVVPMYFDNGSVPVSDERRARLRDELLRLIEEAKSLDHKAVEASAEPIAPATEDNKLAILFQNGCTACGGHCCTTGADNGHLDARKLHDYLRAHPDAEPDDVVAHYSSFLPEKANAESCIFRSDKGCVLPRDMRADICNTFECYGLRAMRHEYEEGHDRMLAVACHDEQMLSHRFADASDTD